MHPEPHRRRGIPYNDATFVHYFNVPRAQIGWCYNWDSTTTDPHTPYLEYVPMLWGSDAQYTQRWWDAVTRAANVQPADPTHLLGFNEPDNCVHGAGGSCISVAEAVVAWKKFMEPAKLLKQKMYLGSPAVTNSGTAGMGLEWLRAFMAACKGCSVDFVCVHWYDAARNPGYFKDHLNAVRGVAGGRPIWITEFAPAGSDGEIKAFLDDVIPWMDGSEDIHRYAYFMAREGFLVNGEGSGMSDVGRHFAFWGAEKGESEGR